MIRPAPDGILLTVRVIPRAAKAGIAGTRDGALLVRLHAPPVEGAANAELVETVAGALGVPRRTVTLAAGEHSRLKTLRITGLTASEAEQRLAPR